MSSRCFRVLASFRQTRDRSLRSRRWALTSLLCLLGIALLVGRACAQSANPIVTENALPGNPASEWDLTNGVSDANIQGFATDISVNCGNTISFKINTAALAYHLDIYRLGYYGGLGARKVATVQPSTLLPQSQPGPANDSSGLADYGTWAVSASWAVPATATSGIYIAKLVRDDLVPSSGSHIIFIVRNDSSASALYFQASDTTWQAYNRYGGASLYDGEPTARVHKVSYNRPFTTRDYRPENFVFNAEYPMVRWLEANGYDVSYSAEIDTDRNGGLLLNHKVFLSVGHDEYWSGNQRANVEAARNAGHHLAFFSGNECFWKTRYEASIDGSNTPYRSLVCYKETHANAKIDPVPGVWTGTWRDPRFSTYPAPNIPPADGGRPENSLSGTMFVVNGYTANSIVVPAEDGKMRFWRNTAVAAQSAGASYTFPVGTLGYEWDEDRDNGSRPPGLVHLSTATVGGVTVLLDFGSNYATGTKTHNMTLYRQPSGALVFGAGTMQWSWGLDNNHDYSRYIAADTNIQQATVNLFADMGVQPGSLQAGLSAASASTDTTPPTSKITSPVANAALKGDTIVTIAGTATDTGGGVVGGVEVSTDGGVTWHPAQGRAKWTYAWRVNGMGTHTLLSRATDDSGNIEQPSAGIHVTVSDPVSLWNDYDLPGAISADSGAVELGVKLRFASAGSVLGVRFYKGFPNTGTHIGHLWDNLGNKLAEMTFVNETVSGWQEVLFSSPFSVQANTTYIASYHTDTGYYATDNFYFGVTGYAAGGLQALQNGVDGGNGVYVYGASAFPSQSYNATNYWVDVIFAPNPVLTIPAAPTRLQVTAANQASVSLAWQDNATNEAGYRIERSLNATSFSEIATVAANVTTFTDTGVTKNKTYYYRVRAYNAAGNSNYSPIVTVKTVGK